MRSVPEGRWTVAGDEGLSAGREPPDDGRWGDFRPGWVGGSVMGLGMGGVLAWLHRAMPFRRPVRDARKGGEDVPVVGTTGYSPGVPPGRGL